MAQKAGKGAKAPSKSTIDRFLNPKQAGAPSAPAAPSPPALPPGLLDPERTKYTPDDLISDTVASLRVQQGLSRTFYEQGDYPRANAAAKLVGYYTGVLQKLQKSDEDEAGTVRVSLESVQASADRAWESLETTAAAVIAEMATWPLCSSCGRRHGSFASGDKSRIRALFERVAIGGT